MVNYLSIARNVVLIVIVVFIQIDLLLPEYVVICLIWSKVKVIHRYSPVFFLYFIDSTL